jgi:L,D-transpeptidase catalytic domain
MAQRIALAVAILVSVSLAGDLSVRAEPVAGAKPRPAKRTAVARPSPSPASKSTAALGTLVAHVRPGRVVTVRSGPNGPVVARLSSRTEFGSGRTFAVTRTGRRLAVITSELPNGRVGWLDTGSGSLRFSRTRVTLDVDLSARELRVRGGGRVIRRMRVGTGARGTPTPTGRFAITDKLRGSDFSASAYGCCILALSGHQTSLPRAGPAATAWRFTKARPRGQSAPAASTPPRATSCG